MVLTLNLTQNKEKSHFMNTTNEIKIPFTKKQETKL